MRFHQGAVPGAEYLDEGWNPYEGVFPFLTRVTGAETPQSTSILQERNLYGKQLQVLFLCALHPSCPKSIHF